ncbi:MAG: fibronectin type III domain-containing protein, partial [Actinobacteria bacterium]|nr:fibronectin type III domain-containing protein [Actinomycetota bacterium]
MRVLEHRRKMGGSTRRLSLIMAIVMTNSLAMFLGAGASADTGCLDARVIAAGSGHSLLIDGFGTVWAWGNADKGQLGDGTTTSRSFLVAVPGMTDAIGVAAGLNHSLVLKRDGSVWAWGDDSHGQLGDGATTASSSPIQVTGMPAITAISASGNHSLARASNGTVWSWGENRHGQVGDGSFVDSPRPRQIAGLGPIVKISAGSNHSLAIKDDLTVVAWGDGSSGQLGNGGLTDLPLPTPVPGLTSIRSIAGGGRHSLARNDSGVVFGWGDNSHGQLGSGLPGTSPLPVVANVVVPAQHKVSAIAAGGEHSAALTDYAELYTWGSNASGQLGNRPLGSDSFVPSFVAVAMTFALGQSYTMFPSSDFTLYAMGANGKGQLGDSTTIDRPLPVLAGCPFPGSPGKPTNVIGTAGDSSASVTWTAPPSSSPITSYSVVAANLSTSPPKKQRQFITSPDGSSVPTAATFAGLVNGQKYSFTVIAFDRFGYGYPSTPSNQVTPLWLKPSAPQSVVATRNGR